MNTLCAISINRENMLEADPKPQQQANTSMPVQALQAALRSRTCRLCRPPPAVRWVRAARGCAIAGPSHHDCLLRAPPPCLPLLLLLLAPPRVPAPRWQARACRQVLQLHCPPVAQHLQHLLQQPQRRQAAPGQVVQAGPTSCFVGQAEWDLLPRRAQRGEQRGERQGVEAQGRPWQGQGRQLPEPVWRFDWLGA